ncbi:uncharacterized protein CTRU02_215816 [Colletotrichum truncatum]|uniref:Uncharacterized protein n=1 Tax=Colletotrichum truncatum TaxID=5467 RepID=A0ACC3YBU2_COLTU
MGVKTVTRWQAVEPHHPVDDFTTLAIDVRTNPDPDPDSTNNIQTFHLCLHAGRPHRQNLAIHFHDDGSIYLTDAPYGGIPRRPYGIIRIKGVANLHALDDDSACDTASTSCDPLSTDSNHINNINNDDNKDARAAINLPHSSPPPVKHNQAWLLIAKSSLLSPFIVQLTTSSGLIIRSICCFSEIKRDSHPKREQYSLALIQRLMNVAQFVCGLFLPTTNIHVNAGPSLPAYFNHCHLFLFLGQWLAEGTLHLDAASSARYSPLTLRVARLFLRYLSPKLPLPSTNNDKPSPIDGCDGRVELLRYIPQLPLLIAQVAPLLGPVKALFETHIIPSLRDSKPTYADLVLLNEMIRHSHLLSLRMTAVLQQAEYLRVALSAVNADALWSPVITNNDGDTTETASLWNSSMLDGWAGSHEKLASVEDIPVSQLRRGKLERIPWCLCAHLAMFRHFARHKPDCSEYPALVYPRVQRALEAKFVKLGKKGTIVEGPDKTCVWSPWTALWAHPDWDGEIEPPPLPPACEEATAPKIDHAASRVNIAPTSKFTESFDPAYQSPPPSTVSAAPVDQDQTQNGLISSGIATTAFEASYVPSNPPPRLAETSDLSTTAFDPSYAPSRAAASFPSPRSSRLPTNSFDSSYELSFTQDNRVHTRKRSMAWRNPTSAIMSPPASHRSRHWCGDEENPFLESQGFDNDVVFPGDSSSNINGRYGKTTTSKSTQRGRALSSSHRPETGTS